MLPNAPTPDFVLSYEIRSFRFYCTHRCLVCCTLDIIYINCNTIFQFQSFSLSVFYSVFVIYIFLAIQKLFPEVPTGCLEYSVTLETKILRLLKSVSCGICSYYADNCSNRTSSSSSVDVDLCGRMGLSSLCSTSIITVNQTVT